jgi:hypothetical protein
MMSPKNKPNSKPIQTQFAKRPKMLQAQYIQRIKKIKADWLYLKQSQFKPNFIGQKSVFNILFSAIWQSS